MALTNELICMLFSESNERFFAQEFEIWKEFAHMLGISLFLFQWFNSNHPKQIVLNNYKSLPKYMDTIDTGKKSCSFCELFYFS